MPINHVFENQPDSRLSTDPASKPSRFRPVYRQLSPEEISLHNDIKAKAVEMEELYKKISSGRYNSLAITSLEESVMWIVKELTS